MVNAAGSAGQVAPPELEPVRALLNSWLIPNDSREPADRFDLFAREQRWRRVDAAPLRAAHLSIEVVSFGGTHVLCPALAFLL